MLRLNIKNRTIARPPSRTTLRESDKAAAIRDLGKANLRSRISRLRLSLGWRDSGMDSLAIGAGLILIFAFFLPIKFADAATLTYHDDSWGITPGYKIAVNNPSIRNDFDLLKLAQTAVLGQRNQGMDRYFDEPTASQINLIANKLYLPAIEPKLAIENGVAVEFEPGQNGQALDVYALRRLLDVASLIDLSVMVSAP